MKQIIVNNVYVNIYTFLGIRKRYINIIRCNLFMYLYFYSRELMLQLILFIWYMIYITAIIYICFTILFHNPSMNMVVKNNWKTDVWNVYIEMNKYINALYNIQHILLTNVINTYYIIYIWNVSRKMNIQL